MRTLGLLFAVMAIAGCRTTGVFEAPGHIEKVGDAYYGYIGESNECYIVSAHKSLDPAAGAGFLAARRPRVACGCL